MFSRVGSQGLRSEHVGEGVRSYVRQDAGGTGRNTSPGEARKHHLSGTEVGILCNMLLGFSRPGNGHSQRLGSQCSTFLSERNTTAD